jgi:nucleotide-binding universal stress UspA family protein
MRRPPVGASVSSMPQNARVADAPATERPVVLVGYDGTDESRDALALARLLAPALEAELHVVAVFVHAPLEVEGTLYARLVQEETERLEHEIRDQLGELPARTLVVPAASAAGALHGLAERQDAALIVLGSTHRGTLGRILPGSVGERLLAAGPSAVAVAPRGFASRTETALRSLGVAWTDGPESERALAFAAELAERAGSALRLLTVVEPVSHLVPAGPSGVGAWSALEGTFEQVEAQETTERGRILSAVRKSLPAHLEASSELLRGDPVDRLIESSTELDLLVLGSRGYGPLKRVLLGSVSSPILRRAECPVVVVPRAAGTEN